MSKPTASRIDLTREERLGGILAMWDVIGQRGHYVIKFGARGFSGYQLERNDGPGESELEPWQVQGIVRQFNLAA